MAPGENISPLSACPRHFPLQRGFRPAGPVEWAEPAVCVPPYLTKPRRYIGRRAAGVRYEEQVHEHLAGLAKEEDCVAYIPSQWWKFFSGEHARFAQTDGLLVDPLRGLVVVVEVKYQHTPDAWFQLRELYEPIVSKAFGKDWTVALLEVVRWYDPDVFFPERVVMCASPFDPPRPGIGVHIWCP